MKRTLFVILFCLVFVAGFGLSMYLHPGFNVIEAQKATSFLLADFDRDGKYDKIYINKFPNDKDFLVIESGGRELCHIPFFAYFKEPFNNTRLAISYEGNNYHLIIRDKMNNPGNVYVFNGYKIAITKPTKSDLKILDEM
jgi:hypothetical protein